MLSKRSKRVFSILLTIALIFGISATNAMAVTLTTPDSKQPVSLTVQKYLTPQPSTTAGDGVTAPTDTTTLKLAQYVEFTLTKLENVDEKTTVENAQKTSTVYTGVTDANGQILWSTAKDQLAQGFYLLEETKSPYNGTKSTENPTGILAAVAAPSIIALPYANGSTYNYDVKVFPKNVGDVNTKTVVNPENVYKPGDIVKWNIETVITSDRVESYSIKDTLDSRLDYVSAAVSMIIPGKTSVALVQGADYTVTNNVSVVTIDLTSAGLAKVTAEGATAISTDLTTKINDTAFTTGTNDVIVNSAALDFTNKGETSQTVTIPQSASITLSSFVLNKVNKEDKALEGAEFKIAATEADALAGNFMKDANGKDVVLTTVADGTASASGIPYADSEVTKDGTGNIVSINVYLVETKAPAGYDLLQKDVVGVGMQPIVAKVTMTLGTSQTVEDAQKKTVTYTDFTGAVKVVNYKAFTLPITGGAGTIIFTVVGLILILGAAFILIKTRKKEVVK